MQTEKSILKKWQAKPSVSVLYQLIKKLINNQLFLIITAIIGSVLITEGCFAQAEITNNAFSAGEDVEYQVYYNWGFIWMEAAWVRFAVDETQWDQKPALHLVSTGSTLSGYDWFYKVRDRYETIVDPVTLMPYWFKCETNEGKNWARETYNFYPENNLIVTQTANAKHSFRVDSIKVKPRTTDLLTAIYLCRNLDFSNLKIDTRIPIYCVVTNKKYDLYMRYLGRETIENRHDQKFNCYKFTVLLVDGSIFDGGEDMTVWVSDDNNRIPILIEAKIQVGSIKAYVKTINGNRWPMVKPVGDPSF
jgi:hypothetical protein